MNIRIEEARTPEAVARCFPVMQQLRTHFEDEKTFVAQVERQHTDGYRMAYLEDIFQGQIETLYSNPKNIEDALALAEGTEI